MTHFISCIHTPRSDMSFVCGVCAVLIYCIYAVEFTVNFSQDEINVVRDVFQLILLHYISSKYICSGLLVLIRLCPDIHQGYYYRPLDAGQQCQCKPIRMSPM